MASWQKNFLLKSLNTIGRLITLSLSISFLLPGYVSDCGNTKNIQNGTPIISTVLFLVYIILMREKHIYLVIFDVVLFFAASMYLTDVYETNIKYLTLCLQDTS